MLGSSRRHGAGAKRTVAAFVAVFAASVVTGCGHHESPAAPESVPAAGFAAGESQAAERDLGAVIGALAGEAELSAEQARAISALTVATSVPREPRESWLLAAELVGILTDEQLISIERSMETAREIHRSQFRARRGDGQEGARPPRVRGHRQSEQARTGEPGARAEQRMARQQARWALEHTAMAEVLELTETQSKALRALAAERPDSAAGPDWRESRRRAIASVLTDEQRQIVTLHRLVLGHRLRVVAGSGHRLRPGARVQDAWVP
jgi:hypothetical protein